MKFSVSKTHFIVKLISGKFSVPWKKEKCSLMFFYEIKCSKKKGNGFALASGKKCANKM